MFDANDFLAAEQELNLSDTYVVVPEGVYEAVITEVKAALIKDKPVMYVEWELNDLNLKESFGEANPSVRQVLWLDLVEGSNTLDTGVNKNVGLARLRTAVGQNNGQAWAPNHLVGQVAKIEVKHTMNNDGEVFANVRGVKSPN